MRVWVVLVVMLLWKILWVQIVFVQIFFACCPCNSRGIGNNKVSWRLECWYIYQKMLLPLHRRTHTHTGLCTHPLFACFLPCKQVKPVGALFAVWGREIVVSLSNVCVSFNGKIKLLQLSFFSSVIIVQSTFLYQSLGTKNGNWFYKHV